MKRIGILTYFGDLNSGTNMQAYSLKKLLSDKYGQSYNIEIINYHAWRKYWLPYLSSMTYNSLKNDYSRLRKYKKFIGEFIDPSFNKIVSKDPNKVWETIKSKEYDAIYVGSDTLLELDRYGSNEISAFWLPSDVRCKKFLVAASANNLNYRDLSKYQKLHLANSIKETSLLGVRDKVTYDLIKNFVDEYDERLCIVPDPTFSYSINYDHVEKYLQKKRIDIKKPIIGIHFTRNFIHGEELAKKIKKMGYQVASFRPASYADILLNDMSPLEVSGIFKYFDCMITHRFHDAIFAIKNLTPVIVVPPIREKSESIKESKHSYLLRQFGIQDLSLIPNFMEVNTEAIIKKIENILSEFNKENVNSILTNLNVEFHKYIEKTINICTSL